MTIALPSVESVPDLDLLSNESNLLKELNFKSEYTPNWSGLNSQKNISIHMDVDTLSTEDALQLFYKHIFPFSRLYKWLNYNNKIKSYFSRREFSFTLSNDIYLRFQSFISEQDMTDKVCKLSPIKIDIGAVYSARPSERKCLSSNSFKPVEKEMVIDIDMTDYDDVRSCCTDKSICLRCWRFIAIAVKILDRSLREDFGFSNCLWVFSGRRGVHCWIADERARKMDNNARKAIISYLELIKGGAEQRKKVILSSDLLHPLVAESVRTIEPIFSKLLINEQDFLTSENQIKKMLQLIPDEQFKEGLSKVWLSNKLSSNDRWTYFINELEQYQNRKSSKFSMKHLKEEIILQFCYPRLDANVSIQLNHLLKSPFCVHPDTGKICIPFLADQVDSFDPSNVPLVRNVLKEVYSYDGDTSSSIVDLSNTSLAIGIDIFDNFLNNLEKDYIKAKSIERDTEDAKMLY